MRPEAPSDALILSGLNLIPQAISIFDADLRLVVGNRAFSTMFALPEALTRPGAGFEDIVRHLALRGDYGPMEDAEAGIAQRVEAARAFQPHYMERARANGRIIAVEGAPLAEGGWITVYTDITETRRQESLLRARSDALSEELVTHAERLAAANRELAATNAALREAQRILTEAEARTRHVTEMMPAHIAHMDPALRYTFSNNQLPAVFPGTERSVIGLHGRDVLGEATYALIEPRLRRAMAGQAQVFEITHDASGRRIRIALTPDPSSDLTGGGGVYVLSTDVTEEVRAREALMQTARRSLAAQITSGLAHDFGNLLTIILGLQDRLARADLSETAAADVQATLAAARRGTALLNRIAGITGPRRLTAQPANPGLVLSDLAVMARPSLGDRVELVLDVDTGDGLALMDAGALQDSVLNLLLNARDAMQGHGQILLRARRSEDWLSVTVSDTGPGFAPEVLARAAEPFFTTKGGQGSGLGLSMVYDHAKLAGGSMQIGNRRDGVSGAMLRLRLPAPEVRPLLILLVEDEEAIRTALREALTAQGHAVVEAGTLAEGMALAEVAGVQAVVSDMQLPDGLGRDLVAGLGLPSVLMTALPADDPRRAGAPCPVLSKPVDPADLIAHLTELSHG